MKRYTTIIIITGALVGVGVTAWLIMRRREGYVTSPPGMKVHRVTGRDMVSPESLTDPNAYRGPLEQAKYAKSGFEDPDFGATMVFPTPNSDNLAAPELDINNPLNYIPERHVYNPTLGRMSRGRDWLRGDVDIKPDDPLKMVPIGDGRYTNLANRSQYSLPGYMTMDTPGSGHLKVHLKEGDAASRNPVTLWDK